MNHPQKPLAERFWKRVRKTETCWWWEGITNGRYGRIQDNKRSILTHRVAWTLAFGPVPPGLSVLHHCDNTLCVNPDHLFIGTQGDNMRDAAAKGRNVSQKSPERLARGDAHGLRKHPELAARGANHGAHIHPEKLARGERQGSAKLTAEVIRIARADLAEGRASLTQLSDRYGVARSTMREAITRKTWAHVS